MERQRERDYEATVPMHSTVDWYAGFYCFDVYESEWLVFGLPSNDILWKTELFLPLK